MTSVVPGSQPGNSRSREWAKAVALLAVAVALLVGIGRSRRPSTWRDAPGHERPDAHDPALADPALAARAFAAARGAAGGHARPPSGDASRVWLCRHALPAKAQCVEGRGLDVEDAAAQGASGSGWLATGTLTLDVLERAEPGRWPADAWPHEAGRFGIEVGPAVVLPWEILGLRLFRTEDEDDPPAWDEDAVRQLIERRGGKLEGAFQRLGTVSWVQAAPGEAPVRLDRLHAWDPPDTSADALAADARAIADHLASITRPDGRIRYRFDPTTGRELPGENLLRHAGSAYALVQAWERFGDPVHREAARRAIVYLLGRTGVDERQGPHGGGRARYVVEGTHLKLGGAALALVAIDRFRLATGERDAWATEAGELATFLLSQQDEAGAFVSFASREPGGAARDESSAYYPGEAILGLTLHAGLDPDPRWLAAAERGARWLAEVRDAGKDASEIPADHWLMIATGHLHEATGDDHWVDEGLRLAAAVLHQAAEQEGHAAFHPDFAGGFYDTPRSTPSSIRAEGLAAVLGSCDRAGRDCAALEPVFEAAVGHALRSLVEPRTDFWVQRPEQALGGVQGGVLDPVLRNDYAQHTLSAVLGAEAWRRRRAAGAGAPR